MVISNYHRHSHYSNPVITDSVVTNEDYCKRIVELGGTILSSCEHGTPGAWRECADLASKYGLKWRYVSEFYFVKDRKEKDRTNAHLVLAAKTAKGIGDINEAFSEANLTGYYYHGRLDMEILMGLDPRDVFITTACIGGVYKYGFEEAEKIIVEIHNRFGDSFMLEVQNHNTPKQVEVNEFILKMYRKHNIKLIYGMDSHFIYPEQAVLRDHRLEANNIRYPDEEGWYLDYPSYDEAFKRFKEQGVLSDAQIIEAMENTNVFLDFEDVVLSKDKKLPNMYPELSQEERNQLYLDTVMSEWEVYSLGMEDDEKERYVKEILYETEVITSTNTSDYFLIDFEIIKKAKEKGALITQTGRGSAVSYFTNSLLGLSSVDRLQIPVEMFPDRFISKDRLLSGSLPDVDLNCYYAEFVEEAQKEVLGEWASAPMVSFGTLKRASAWKMYCRAANIEYETANEISSELKRYEIDVSYADEEDVDDIDVFSYVPEEYHDLLVESEKYMGMIESIAPHPCGFVLFQGDVRREFGIYRINSKTKKEPVYAAFIDGDTADHYGYVKNDILSVDVVGINKIAFDRVGVPLPSVMELLKMTKDDKETWSMYSKGLTLSLNQVQKQNTTEKIMRYKPKNITELSAFVAAIRPAFQSMINVFLDRQDFNYGIPAFDKLIQTRELTSSFILYQEQIMKTLQYAGFTGPESYSAIKDIAKKHPEKVLKLKERFLREFSKEADAESAEKVWRIIDDATAYLFNASHAVCVAIDSLYGAYLKAHHPFEFYTTILDVYGAKANGKERVAKIKEEMKTGFNITVSPCHFRQDNRSYFIDKEKRTISNALASIKFMSKGAARALYTVGKEQHDDFISVLIRLTTVPEMDTRKTEILIRLGYFKEFGGAIKLLKVYDEFCNGKTKYLKTYVDATKEKRALALREFMASCPDEEDDPVVQVQAEIEFCGTPLSTFPQSGGLFAIIDLDEKYSPRMKLYNMQSGTNGEMKILKKTFKEDPLKIGDVILIEPYQWQKKPKYKYVNKKAQAIPGTSELWLKEFTRVSQ